MFSPIYKQKNIGHHDYLKSILESCPPIEKLSESNDFKESLKSNNAKVNSIKLSDNKIDKIYSGLESIKKDEVVKSEVFNPYTEAIILTTLRPVFIIKNDTFKINDSSIWGHLENNRIKENLERAIPSIGRIELPTDPRMLYVGTGFLVADDLIMTNRHVAEFFCEV